MTNNILGPITAKRKDGRAIQVQGVWYSGFKNIDANKGDDVSIEFEVNEKGGMVYHNIKKIEIIKKAETTFMESKDHRAEVDAGNCLQRATELLIAGKYNALLVATMEVCAAFRLTKKELAKEIKDGTN